VKPALRRLATIAAGDVAGRVLGFFTMVYLARTLLPDAFGLITVGTAVLGYLLLAASPGVQVVETRNVASARAVSRTMVADVLGLRVILAAALWGATAAAATLLFGAGAARDVVVLYAAALVPLAVLLDWFFAGREEFRTLGAGRTLAAAGALGATLLLVREPGDVRGAPTAFLAGSMVGAIVFALAFRVRYGTLRLSWNPAGWWVVLRRNLPVGAATLLGQSSMNLPPILAGLMLGTAGTGVFGAAQRLVPALLLADRVVHALLLPAMTRYWSGPREEARRLYGTALRLLAAVALPAAVVGAAFAPEIISIVYGSAYAEAAPVFMFLLGYVVLTLLNTVSTALLLAAGRDGAYTRAMALSAVALTAFLLLLTPLHGVTGVGAAVLIGEFLALVLLGREVRNLLGAGPLTLLLSLAPAVIVLALVLRLGGEILPAPWVLPAALGAYVIAAVSSRSLRRSEWEFVREKLL
jgi:O-antigen/teichoic acid export membrane protein